MFSYIKSVLFGDEVQQNPLIYIQQLKQSSILISILQNHRQNSATREVNKLQIQVKQRTQYSQDSRLNTTSAALQSKTQPPLNKLDSARGINKSLNFPIKNAINADNSKEISLTNKKNTLQIELIKKQQLKQYDSSQVSSNNQSSVDLQAHMNSAKLQKTLVHPTLIASATNNLNQNLQNNGGTTKQIGRMNINPNSLLNAQKNRNSSLQNNNQIANNFTSTTSDLKFKLNQQLQQTLKVQDFKLNLQSKANQKAEFRLVNHQNLQIDKQLDSSNYQLQSQSIEGSMNIVDSIDANNNNDTFRNDMGGMSIDFKSQSAVAFKNQKYSQYNSNQPSINAGAADKPPSGKKQSSNKSNGDYEFLIFGIQKLFMDSRGAQQAVNALKNKRQYHISQNTLLFELSMPNKDLKFISVNMLCKNLKMIDLQNNKLQSLPEEISDLMFLEKLRVDNNHLKSLPTKLSYLNMLETLTISNNQISELPENLEELSKLKILLLNDNKIKQLTSRIGNLQMLKKLFLHKLLNKILVYQQKYSQFYLTKFINLLYIDKIINKFNNLFSEIPTEIYKLSKLKEFSSEWFLYLKPPMPRIMRDQQGLVIIEKIKNFCRSHSLFTSQNSITSVEQLQQTFQNQQTQLPEYKSFCDFILYYYKLKPSNINSLSFGQKQRGLIHQICINQHAHLLANVLNCGQEHSSSAQIVAKYLDLNQKDKESQIQQLWNNIQYNLCNKYWFIYKRRFYCNMLCFQIRSR